MFVGHKHVLQFEMFASAKNIYLCERCYFVLRMFDAYIVLKCSVVCYISLKMCCDLSFESVKDDCYNCLELFRCTVCMVEGKSFEMFSCMFARLYNCVEMC